jgi:nucleoside-diphosphate-sugar epimerase
VFNIASGNHTVGEVADLVKGAIRERLDVRVSLDLKHIQDFRNYKVSIEKAANVLSFHPAGSVKSIIGNLIENMDKFKDWDNPAYSNIQMFREIDKAVEIHSLEAAA